jgi:hypothetical protein
VRDSVVAVQTGRRVGLVAVVLALAGVGCVAAPERERAVRDEAVIFGADDRIELFEVSDEAMRETFARAVPAMVRASRLSVAADGAVTVSARPLGSAQRLCEGEAHRDQPALASCSATLIDDDLVLTAGHCVDGWACAEQRFVFDWYHEAPGVLAPLDADDVYACADVVAFEYSGSNDFAIVRLDRAPPGPPVPVRRGPVMVNETVSLAGFPLGIPMKVVEAGAVTGTISRSRFYARLDAHPGNSGSGVFDTSLRVVGELTNGPVDAFVVDGDCRRLRVIGEDGWRTETINSVVPALEALCASPHATERLCGEVTIDGGVDAAMAPDAWRAPDAALVRADAAREDAGPDASSAPPLRIATHCGCATEAKRAPGWPGALSLLALGALLRRGRRSASGASRGSGR